MSIISAIMTAFRAAPLNNCKFKRKEKNMQLSNRVLSTEEIREENVSFDLNILMILCAID